MCSGGAVVGGRRRWATGRRWLASVVVLVLAAACSSPSLNLPGSVEHDEEGTLVTVQPDFSRPIEFEPGALRPEIPRPLRFLRINTNNHFRAPEGEDSMVVVEPDGTVLRIRSGNIFAGQESYTTWQLSERGFERLIEEVRASGLAENSSPRDRASKAIAPTGVLMIDNRLIVQLEGLDMTASELSLHEYEIRQSFNDLLMKMEDMSWLGDEVVAPESPWIPEALSILADDAFNEQYYTTDPFPWPFDRTVDEMAEPTVHKDGRLVLCLRDEEAATVWKAMILDGVNNARLPVDDGSFHELNVYISHAGYRLGSDPCPSI